MHNVIVTWYKTKTTHFCMGFDSCMMFFPAGHMLAVLCVKWEQTSERNERTCLESGDWSEQCHTKTHLPRDKDTSSQRSVSILLVSENLDFESYQGPTTNQENMTCHVWCVTCGMWCVHCTKSGKCDVWRMMCEVWSVMCDVCLVSCDVTPTEINCLSISLGVHCTKSGKWKEECLSLSQTSIHNVTNANIAYMYTCTM